MTPIDPAAQLAAIIRTQVSALRRKRPQSANQRKRPEAAAPAPDLAAVVASRIHAIPPDDPERERKALRLFLETVLLSELGEQLINDPAFALMVDHVLEQLESDADLSAAAGEVARMLLKPPAA